MKSLAHLTGDQMLAIAWRSSRWKLLTWTLGIITVFAATAMSIASLYGTSAELKTYADAVGLDSSLSAINGRPFGLDNIGGPIAYEFGFIAAIAIPLMGVILIAGMTRHEEQTGRMELLCAGMIGRTAGLRSALTLTSAAFLTMGLAMAVVLAALGFSWPQAVLYPLSLTLLGTAFTAVGALCAQLVAYSRMVTALGLVVLVIAFVVRGFGDAHGNILVWLSPLGWAEQTRAFGDARWWPLLPLIALTMVASVAALRLAERRDLGRGLFARHRGNPQAPRALLNTYGFAVRRHRNAVAGWSAIAALVGATFGSVGDAYNAVTEDNATLRDLIGGGSTASNAYVSFVVILLALICVAFVISGIGKTADEESSGRLEPVLAGAASRLRWLAADEVALLGGMVLVCLIGGLGLGIGNAVSTGDSTQVWRLVGAAAAYLPAVALLLGLSAVLYGLRPNLMWVSWFPLVFVAVVAVLGDTLQLPKLVQNISPISWVGRVPLQSAGAMALACTVLVALLLAAIALVAFRRRDIPSH